MAKGAARDLRKEEVWRRRLARQAESGQSVRAWCRRHRVTETAFYWWRRELARRDAERKRSARAAAPGRAVAFVPVRVAGDPGRDADPEPAGSRDGDAPLEIVWPDGRRVRIAGPVSRPRLIAVLEALAAADVSAAERRLC